MSDYFETACYYDDYPHPCSHCGLIIYFELIDDELYCPECGQMVEEESEE